MGKIVYQIEGWRVRQEDKGGFSIFTGKKPIFTHSSFNVCKEKCLLLRDIKVVSVNPKIVVKPYIKEGDVVYGVFYQDRLVETTSKNKCLCIAEGILEQKYMYRKYWQSVRV